MHRGNATLPRQVALPCLVVASLRAASATHDLRHPPPSPERPPDPLAAPLVGRHEPALARS